MNETILLIEDNEMMRENTMEILELSNYKVITAENGKVGLEKARECKPDLILCDIMMPELDGYAVLRAVENNPDLIGTPFVFLTAKSEKKDFRQGMDLGADDYLTKPFSGDDLLRVVSTRMKKSSLIKRTFSNTVEGLDSFIKEAKTMYDLAALSGQRTIKKIKSRDTVYSEGDSPGHLYFIESGKLKAFKTNRDGKELVTAMYKEGDFFGFRSLLEYGPQKETVTAVEDASLIIIPRQDFFQLLYSNAEVSLAFIKLLNNNLSDSDEKLLKLAYDTARKKVAEALLFIGKKYYPDKTGRISFPASRDNLSSIAGLSPESVSRNLTELRESGLIEIQNGKVTILDQAALQDLKW